MKTSQKTSQLAVLLAALTTEIKDSLPVRIRLSLLRLLTVLCGTFTATAVLGQVTYTWSGAGDGTNIATAANWSPSGGPPSGVNQDTGEWNGTVAGNLAVTYISGLPGTGFGTEGVNWYIAAGQVGSFSLVCPSGNSGTIAFNNITVDSGTGPVTFGDNTDNQLNFVGRPAGATHEMLNNSVTPVTINPSVRWQAGGGTAYVLDFTGNWTINNYLRNDNGSGPTTVALESGTLTWAADPVQRGNSPSGPIDIFAGTMILTSPNLAPSEAPGTVAVGNNVIQNDGTVEFNAPAQSDNISRVISGSGVVQVNNGTLTLSGANIYTGNTVLSGGELIAGIVENPGVAGPFGEGGMILFSGGTLGWSVNNTYDYSATFSTAASQAYSFDTGGQLVTLATGLSSSGGTLAKVGSGTLTLSGASTYTGNTTVSAGVLIFQGAKAGTGSISVADGTTLDVFATGTQVTPATLAVGTSSGATLAFDSVNSTTTAPVAAGTLTSAGTVTVNINSGTFTVGQSYPLLSWTSGTVPTVSLGVLNGYIGNLSFSGNTLKLNITGTAYSWTGLNNGNWDTTTANNWIQNGGPAVFANGAPVLFADTATGTTNVTVDALVLPTTVTFNNNSLIYSVTSSSGKDIGGTASLTKSGLSTVALSGGFNSYTGITTVNGGTLSVGTLANGGTASDIGAAANSAGNLLFNSGTLQFIGGTATSDHLFTLTTAGGAIDASGSGLLNLNNAGLVGYSGTGARVLTLTGTNAGTLAASIADNGGSTSLAKNGAGTWVLTGTNTESGATTIANGELQIGAGGASGSIGSGSINDNGVLDFNVTSTLTVSGAISGSGTVTNDGSGTVILANNDSYTGGTTVNAGTLQVGNGGSSGQLNANGTITNNSTLIFNSTGTFFLSAAINGTGQVIKQGSGLLKLLGANTYTGGTTVAAGGVLQICSGNQGAIMGNITNNGSLTFVRQDNSVFGVPGVISGTGSVSEDVNNTQPGDTTFSNNCTYTGGTFIKGGAIILGDGMTPGVGMIVGNVTFTNSSVSDDAKTITFDRPDNVTFPGLISGTGTTVGANQGGLEQEGFGVLTLTGNNTFVGPTLVTNGVLQIGTGGTSGAIGSTNTVTVWSTLLFDRSDSVTLKGGINGTGLVAQNGSGTLTLAGNLAMILTVITTNADSSTTTNSTYGSIVASNGTLVANSPGGIINNNLSVSGGTLVAGAVGTISTLSVSNNMNISSGTILASLNTSSSPSNTVYAVTGTLTSTGGSLKLVNAGPALVAGDKFTIFNQPVIGGAGMTIVSPGFTVANNLAVDGSVSVVTVSPPPAITTRVSAGVLTLTWPSSWTGGVLLQAQTNSLSVGIKANWVTIPGTDAGNSYSTSINSTNPAVFYRLVEE
jgi:autotransporter-associated beta strand protein